MIQNLKNILAPIDFSHYSMDALRGAWELARDVNADLHVLHAVVPVNTVLSHITGEQTREVAREAAMVEQAEQELERIKRDELDNSRKVTTAVIVGHPVATIAAYAAKNQIDMVLLASYGRTGAEHLLGSVAERLVRHAPCSVLIFRRPSR